jgi:hypothetical protein
MTTAVPFPPQPGPAHRAGSVTLIPERNEFIPPSYVPHKDPGSIVVKLNGQPLEGGFTVAEMLPERRWAVGPDGELMPQLEFAEKYQRKLYDWFQYASVEGRAGRGKVPSSFAVHREPIPNVAHYVAFRVDLRDSRQILPMGFDPDATKGTQPKRLWNSAEERFVEGAERLSILVEAYRLEQSGGRRTLKSYEREEVEAHLSGTKSIPQVANQTQAKIQVLTELRSAGTINDEQYAASVAKLFGVQGPAQLTENQQYPARSGYTRMVCGVEVLNLHRKRHLESCEVCPK